MFGKKKSSENPLPQPPTAEEILQDLEKAGPDDVVFTTEISALSCEKTLDSVPRDFALKKRFEVNIKKIIRILKAK